MSGIRTIQLQDGIEFIKRDGSVAFINSISLGSNTISDVSIPLLDTDVATKQYVDSNVLTNIVAGLGLSKSGNTLNINVDGVTLEINLDNLRVKASGISTNHIQDNAITRDKINPDIAGNGLNQNITGALDVNVDATTLQISSGILSVLDVTKNEINPDIAGNGLNQNIDGSLEVNHDNSSLEVISDLLQVKTSGIITSKLANNSVDRFKINSDIAGNGLNQNVDGSLEININPTSLEITADTLNIKEVGITKSKINSDVAGLGLSKDVDGSLKVESDNSTIEIFADKLRLKDLGISTIKLANDSVTKDKINSDIVGNGLNQNVDGSLEINPDDITLSIVANTLQIKNASITDVKISNTASIATSKLADGLEFIKRDGSVSFVSIINGIDPISSSNLATKNYVDSTTTFSVIEKLALEMKLAFKTANINNFKENTFISGDLTNVSIYTDSGKLTKLFSKNLIYGSGRLIQTILTRISDSFTLTQNFVYDGSGQLSTITSIAA